jgi:hypothetical protein
MDDDLTIEVDVPDLRDVHRAVTLAGNLRLFPRFTAHAAGPAIPFDVDLDAVFDDGRFRVTNLTAVRRPGGEGVTSEGLRLIPVSRILQGAVEHILITGEWGSEVVDWGPAVLPERGPRSGPDDEALKLVAALYRLAYVVSVPPTRYVAERLELPQSTAGRWVSLSRKAGHLGSAVGTRPGESTPVKKKSPKRGSSRG